MKKKERKVLIKNYKGSSCLFYGSLALVVLLSLPTYEEQGLLAGVMQGFSEWVAGWFSQLDVIAATRENPVKTRIVLACVVAMAPVHAGYFLWTMPAKVVQERLSNSEMIGRLWTATWMSAVAGISLVMTLHVLTAPGWESPRAIARRFMPIIESDIGSGVMFTLVLSGTVQGLSAILVFIILLVFRSFNVREIHK